MRTMRSRLLCATAMMSMLACCVSVPTPSGMPELKVRMPLADAKARLVDNYSGLGWMTHSSDDVGIAFGDGGGWLLRFSLLAIPDGTQIRAVLRHLPTGGDGSRHVAGMQTQNALEAVFADCMIDGPYARRSVTEERQ